MNNEIPTIKINMDEKCSACGKGGACQNGLCLSCVNKRMKEKYAMKIGPNTISAMELTARELFIEYGKDINEAYLKAGDDFLMITLKFKLSPKDQGTEIETSISFTKEQIKDKVKNFVDEEQGNLFEK